MIQHLFEGIVALNPGLGDVRDVASITETSPYKSDPNFSS